MRWKGRAKGVLDRALTILVSSIFFGMAVLTILLVILRYVFNSSVPGGPEALRFAFIYTTFLGAAVLIGSRDHIAIHLATRKMPRPLQRAVAAFGNLAVAALHVYFIILSLPWIATSGGNLAEELKIPLVYIQIALPIGCGLASLYSLSNAVDALFDRTWATNEEPE